MPLATNLTSRALTSNRAWPSGVQSGDMEENTLKLLRDLAQHAREVAGKIHQLPLSNALMYSTAQDHDKKLREIEEQLLRVAGAIDSYNKASI
jgi:hypothetical protein